MGGCQLARRVVSGFVSGWLDSARAEVETERAFGDTDFIVSGWRLTFMFDSVDRRTSVWDMCHCPIDRSHCTSCFRLSTWITRIACLVGEFGGLTLENLDND